MTDSKQKLNPSEQFQLISEKREALEKLIRIAHGVENQQKALSELALAAKPSQEFPDQVVKYFGAIEERMKSLAVPDILKKLQSVEKVTNETIEDILMLTRLDINSLRDDQIEKISLDSFTDSIDNFKRRSQTALALRFVLKKRGVAVAPLKLPLSQEHIALQVKQLKQKENQCAQQVKHEVIAIIEDTSLLMRQGNLPEEMNSSLQMIRKAMQQNLAHLQNGGLVSEIPNAFESVTLESSPVDSITSQSSPTDDSPEAHSSDSENKGADPEMVEEDVSAASDNSNDNDDTSGKAEQRPQPDSQSQPRPSFWWILKTWLSSPWSTSWRSIKSKYSDKR